MKSFKKHGFGKQSFLAVVVLIVAALAGCSKTVTPTPVKKDPPIVSGSYKLTRDQGSDNGDANYYDRPVDATVRFVFTATHLTIYTSKGTFEYDWTYDLSSKMLTISHGGNSSKIEIEDLTPTGLIWNAIATGVDNARYTLVLTK